MHVQSVHLKNFRNHQDTRLEFGHGINALVGNNGQGKTNVLEAISYLSLTKSFFSASDETTLQLGKDRFEIEGTILTSQGGEHRVRCLYTHPSREKLFTINAAAPESLTSVIGRFPIVVLSPEKSVITTGAPVDRRRFVDLLLSQISRTYFDDLLEYRKVVRQRNRILAEWRASSARRPEVLEPWDENLVRYGSRVVKRRRQFVREIEQYVKVAYAQLVARGEEPAIEYSSSIAALRPDAEEDEIAALLRAELKRRLPEELVRGMSLTGPHRDDLKLLLNGASVRDYGSQGQHKTYLLALKLAEFAYVRERRDEPPIFLLDDVFGELDRVRTERILELIAGLGQTILTATDERVFHGAVQWSASCKRFYVENGTCGAH